MEWSWLKDWWRLKKLRHKNKVRHSTERNVHDPDDSSSSSSDEIDGDICYCDECMNVKNISSKLNNIKIKSHMYLIKLNKKKKIIGGHWHLWWAKWWRRFRWQCVVQFRQASSCWYMCDGQENTVETNERDLNPPSRIRIHSNGCLSGRSYSEGTYFVVAINNISIVDFNSSTNALKNGHNYYQF